MNYLEMKTAASSSAPSFGDILCSLSPTVWVFSQQPQGLRVHCWPRALVTLKHAGRKVRWHLPPSQFKNLRLFWGRTNHSRHTHMHICTNIWLKSELSIPGDLTHFYNSWQHIPRMGTHEEIFMVWPHSIVIWSSPQIGITLATKKHSTVPTVSSRS